MRLTDFIYDGMNLSEFGMIPCNFNSYGETLNIGSELDMNVKKSARKDRYWSIGAGYHQPFTCSFSLIKDPCQEEAEEFIAVEQVNELVRWLNRRTFRKFEPIYDEDTLDGVYFLASFNVTLETAGDKVIGLNLEMTTDSPYGYMEAETKVGKNTQRVTINAEDNWETGYIYPKMTVKPLSSGNLEITNSLETGRKTIVKNCSANEEIIFDGEMKQIVMNNHPMMADDFNYVFPRIITTIDNSNNVFSFNIPCNVTITYSPICKVGLLI